MAATDRGALLGIALLLFASSARAEESSKVAHASLEVGAYHDDVAVTVLTPSIAGRVEDVTGGWALRGRYLVDVVSAASPDIVSTASPRWSEVRHAGNFGGTYRRGLYGFSANGVTSYTPDYLSVAGNVQVTEELDEKNLTLSQGYGYGHDVIGRAGTAFSTFSRELDFHVFSLGVSRVVNPALVLGLFGDLMIERGDQSKPYRYIPIFAPQVAQTIERGASAESIAQMRLQARPLEQLPLARERAALTGRIAWRLSGSTLRAEERIYADTWGLKASTTDVRWLFDAGERVILWPHVRVHVQNGVDFWQRAYAGGPRDLPAFRTGDRELSPLASFGFGGGIRIALGKRGSLDDWVWSTTLDGISTRFADAIYVTRRIAGVIATNLEVLF